jgi:nucleotide-binding universal stress UspA family protein
MHTTLQDTSAANVLSQHLSINNVLYASDFSRPAMAAFPYALAIARMYEAELIIFHALPPAPFDPQSGFVVTPDRLHKSAKEELKRLGRHAARVRHRLVLREGEVWPVLNGFTRKEKVDLIVLGTHGRSGAGRLMLGSVAEEILRRARCPVLTLGPKALDAKIAATQCGVGARRILYATDLSPESRAAAPFALSMTEQNQAKLILLTVLEEPVCDPIQDQEHVLAYVRGELNRIVPEDVRSCCQPECLVELGSAAERILEASRAVDADIIVMGARSAGEHLFAATHFATSTIHQVIAGAACPVLTVLGQTPETERTAS